MADFIVGWDRSITILIAEDDPNDALLLQRAIKRAGVTSPIQVVSDGEQAIAYFAGEGQFADRTQFPMPGLIFLDIKMPRKNGFEVLGWLQAHPKCSIIPKIVWSSSNQEQDVRVAYRLGANCYLRKSSTAEGWDDLIKRIFDFWELCERPSVSAC